MTYSANHRTPTRDAGGRFASRRAQSARSVLQAPRQRRPAPQAPSAPASACSRAHAAACALPGGFVRRAPQPPRLSSGELGPTSASMVSHLDDCARPSCCSPAGSYCVAGAGSPTLCPTGTYGSTTGLATSACTGPCPCCGVGATTLLSGTCSQSSSSTMTATLSPYIFTTVGVDTPLNLYDLSISHTVLFARSSRFQRQLLQAL